MCRDEGNYVAPVTLKSEKDDLPEGIDFMVEVKNTSPHLVKTR